MRAPHFLAAALALTGCKWTDFDDLADETWVRSLDEPDVGSSDYPVAIAGVSGTSGGTLAVISDDSARFSTIDYSAAGEASIGSNRVDLGDQQIGALSDAPAFATDGSRIGLAERASNGGGFAVVHGPATATTGVLVASTEVPVPTPADAAFVGTDFVFAAGSKLFTVPMAGSPVDCVLQDDAATNIDIAAFAVTSTDVLVWTRTGALLAYPTAAVVPCPAAATMVSGTLVTTTSSVMPGPGSRILLDGTNAVLVGVTTGPSGQVVVLDVSTTAAPVERATLTVDGLRSAALGSFDGTTYLALGAPSRSVDGVAAGAVDLHVLPDTGELEASPALTLHDADPESGQSFGRTVTTMDFNAVPILVVGASNEVFAYYRTALYNQQP